jgi:hypothetical protein
MVSWPWKTAISGEVRNPEQKLTPTNSNDNGDYAAHNHYGGDDVYPRIVKVELNSTNAQSATNRYSRNPNHTHRPAFGRVVHSRLASPTTNTSLAIDTVMAPNLHLA